MIVSTCAVAANSTVHKYLRYDTRELQDELHLKPIGDTKVEKMTGEAMRNLRKATGLSQVKLNVCDGEDIFSHPGEGIILGREKLNEIFHQSEVRQFQKIILFILAHEMGHQLQFRNYGKDRVLNASDPELRVYECQADVLAGKYLLEAFYRFTWSDSLQSEEESARVNDGENEAIVDAFQVAFDLGDESAHLCDHPSKSVRYRAAQLGMADGQATRWHYLPPVPPGLNLPPPSQQEKLLKDRINFEAGETAMSWSLRQARRLSHEDASLLAGIELTENNTTIAPRFIQGLGIVPVYSFNLVYRNSGDTTVRLDLEIGTYLEDVEDSTNLKRRYKGDCFSQKMVLKPNQKRIVSGMVPAVIPGIADPGLRPNLVYYPAEMSLISAESIGSKVDRVDRSQVNPGAR